MKKSKMKTLFVSLVIMLAFLQTMAAMAADSKNPAELKPTYKKVTGQVVSANPTSIVIKGRSKGPLTLAVTDRTDMIGAKAAKAGDRAAVNYRVDRNGNTATRIEVLSVSAKSVSPPAAPAPAASSPKPN
jgi:hypothetical protein